MIQLSNETLMAYADGELDAATRAQVKALLDAAPAARNRLNMFVATGAPLGKLYDAPLRQPVPAHILTLFGVDRPPQKGHVRGRSSPLRLLEAARSTFLRAPQWAGALAFSIPALLIAAGAYWYAHPSNGTDAFVAVRQGQMFAQGPLMDALETAPSGREVALGGERSGSAIEAVLTFTNLQHEFCRQYKVTMPDGGQAGIACRGNDGGWRLDMHVPVAKHPANQGRTAPAGKSGSAVEAAVRNAMEGDALGPADEETLIRKGWKR